MIPHRHAMVGRRGTTLFVAWATVGQAATQILLPAGAQVGDFMIFNYYNGANISGGSGTAFDTKATFGFSKVSCRIVEAGDLATPFSFSSAGPVIVGVWRGPTSMSAAITTLTGTGSTDYNSGTGFVRSGAAVGIVAAGSVGGVGETEIYFRRKIDPLAFRGPFDQAETQLTNGVSYAMGGISDIGGYVDNTPLRVGTEATANTVYAHFYELRN